MQPENWSVVSSKLHGCLLPWICFSLPAIISLDCNALGFLPQSVSDASTKGVLLVVLFSLPVENLLLGPLPQSAGDLPGAGIAVKHVHPWVVVLSLRFKDPDICLHWRMYSKRVRRHSSGTWWNEASENKREGQRGVAAFCKALADFTNQTKLRVLSQHLSKPSACCWSSCPRYVSCQSPPLFWRETEGRKPDNKGEAAK